MAPLTTKRTVADDNEQDPDWMLAHTTPDEIEMWLMDLAPCIELRERKITKFGRLGNDGYIFSDWERAFFVSVNQQYNRRAAGGRYDNLLTGRQLVYLFRMWGKLGESTRKQLEMRL